MTGFLALINWPVLTRQIALVVVGVFLARGVLPEDMRGPVADLLETVLNSLFGAVVIWLGQRREAPAAKIAEVAALPQVEAVKVNDLQIAVDVPSPKVQA